MLTSFFAYLRAAVKNAVLGGISDAMSEIDPDGAAADPSALDTLRARLAPPAPETTKPVRKSKGE